MKKKLMSIMLATSMVCMLLAGCGGSGSTSTPNTAEAEKTEETAENEAVETEQTAEAETPAAEEQTAGTLAAEEQTAGTQEAAVEVTQDAPAPEPEAENNPEDDTEIPDGSEVTESESEDGTKSTEIIKPDGSIRLILEDPDGIKTVTNYDSQLYPQSKVVYDENGNIKSESSYKYDENQSDMSWESTTEYDENGNVAYTSETENVYPQEEGFIYGAEPATGPDKVYPDPTGKGYKYGTELLPTTSETVVKDAQGEVVKTISVDNEKLVAMVEYPDGSYEHYSKIKIFNEKYEVITSIQINYYNPYGERYKMVVFVPGLGRQEIEYDPSGSVIGEHYYREDGTQAY